MQDVHLTLKSARVVRVLLEDPARPRYQLEVSRLTGMGSGTVYPILRHLVSAGWATRWREDIDPAAEGRPRRMLYRLADEAVPAARAAIAAIGEEFGP